MHKFLSGKTANNRKKKLNLWNFLCGDGRVPQTSYPYDLIPERSFPFISGSLKQDISLTCDKCSNVVVWNWLQVLPGGNITHP